jgi:hypothetical protein
LGIAFYIFFKILLFFYKFFYVFGKSIWHWQAELASQFGKSDWHWQLVLASVIGIGKSDWQVKLPFFSCFLLYIAL